MSCFTTILFSEIKYFPNMYQHFEIVKLTCKSLANPTPKPIAPALALATMVEKATIAIAECILNLSIVIVILTLKKEKNIDF